MFSELEEFRKGEEVRTLKGMMKCQNEILKP
jgi:hypothetical protein